MHKKNVVEVVGAADVMNVIKILEIESSLCDDIKQPYKYAGAADEVKYYDGQQRAFKDAIRYLKDMLENKQYIEG